MDSPQYEPGEFTPPRTRADAWKEAAELVTPLVGVPEPSDVLALARWLVEPESAPVVLPEAGETATEWMEALSAVRQDEQGERFEAVVGPTGDAFCFLVEGYPIYLTHNAAKETGVGPRDLLFRRK